MNIPPPATPLSDEEFKRIAEDHALFKEWSDNLGYEDVQKLIDHIAFLQATIAHLRQPVGDEAIAGIAKRHAADDYLRIKDISDTEYGAQLHKDRATLLQALQSRPAPGVTDLVAGLKAAHVALTEAADKFWVFHCNAPSMHGDGSLYATHRKEDKEFMAEKSYQMTAAAKEIEALLNRSAEV